MLLNSGKFIGVKVKYVSTPLTNDEYHGQTNTLIANLNWGGQHNICNHWNYSYSVGLGYGHNLVFFVRNALSGYRLEGGLCVVFIWG